MLECQVTGFFCLKTLLKISAWKLIFIKNFQQYFAVTAVTSELPER